MRSNDKSVQASARRAIDNDQIFNLEHLPQLSELIRLKITLVVDPNEFQGYSSMTLIQYAIKQDKSKSLEYMLGIAKTFAKDYKDIIRSDYKLGNNNLLFLAIDFKSNKCLKVLIDFCKANYAEFTVDISDPFGESPLTRAIKLKNTGAIKMLLDDGKADLFYFDQTKNSLSTFMPFLCIFLFYRNLDDLKKMMDKCISPILEKIEKGRFDKILGDFKKMRFNNNLLKIDEGGDDIYDILSNKGLNAAIEYLAGKTITHIKPISIVNPEENLNNNYVYNSISKEDTTEHQTSKEVDESDLKCFMCNATINLEKCGVCDHYFCQECMNKHKD